VWERRKGKMMKKVTILLLIISSFAFAGGEISFKKQNEKLRRLEDAKLESIRNNIYLINRKKML